MPGAAWLTPRRSWGLRVAMAGLVLIALVLFLRGFYLRELYQYTGEAEWIWPSNDLHAPHPMAAAFYRVVRLHERPLEAVAKICGDRSYVLWINGQLAMAGYNRPAYHLDVVPVTDLLNPGPNLFVIEARSPTSAGGVLFSLDLMPSVEGRREGDPRGRSVVVSNASWKVMDHAWQGYPGQEPHGGDPPWIWGRPPDHPWVYPLAIRHDLPLAQGLSGTEVRLTASAFHRGSDGIWRHRLGQWFRGLLRLDGKLPGPGELAVRVRGEADDPPAFRPVIPLPGQEHWIFGGPVEGSVVEIEGEKPTVSVVLLPLDQNAGP
ncbi:MAG TPA: hypothetical protein ENK19_12340 [Acidobacteria bacterium]|nr:hypothetical protein [Acidobacteriota bacterium]